MRYHLTWITIAIAVIVGVMWLNTSSELPYFVPKAEQVDRRATPQSSSPSTDNEPTPSLPAQSSGTEGISRVVGRQFKEIQTRIENGDLDGALPLAIEAAHRPNNTPAEQYYANTMLSVIYMRKKDFGPAAEAMEAVIGSGANLSGNRRQELKIAAQLHYAARNYPKAAEAAIRYHREFRDDIEVQVIAAQAFYLQKNFGEAANILSSMAQTADETSNPMKEQWLQLWMSSEYENRNYIGVERALKALVKYYPKDQYQRDLQKLQERQQR